MANYTDIPTGEEQGLVSDTIKSVSGKKDTNFYLKLACVGLLCVVAFLSGNVHSRNTVTSMVKAASGYYCQGISSIRADGFCPYGVDPPCIDQTTYVGECVAYGAGYVNCLDSSRADELIEWLNRDVPDLFPNGWQKKSCQEQGYSNWSRNFDFGSALPSFFKDLYMMRFGVDTNTVVFER